MFRYRNTRQPAISPPGGTAGTASAGRWPAMFRCSGPEPRSVPASSPWGPEPMSLRPQLNVLCGRCGKPRGLFHECVSNSRRKQTLKPTVTFGKCPNCTKTITNPLTHVCAPKSDFKRRKKAHEKAAAGEAAREAAPRTATTTPNARTTTARARCASRSRPAGKRATRPDTTAAGSRDTRSASKRATTRASRTASPPARATTSKEITVTQVLIVLGADRRIRRCSCSSSPRRHAGAAAAGAREASAAPTARAASGTGKRFRLGARLVHRGAAGAYRYARTRKLKEN